MVVTLLVRRRADLAALLAKRQLRLDLATNSLAVGRHERKSGDD
jgi:hypothetical protein